MNHPENQGVSGRSSLRQPLDAAARASAEWCFPEIQHAFERVSRALGRILGKRHER